jgi:hypothetical protein
MKKAAFILLLVLSIACKKEEPQKMGFDPYPFIKADSIAFDSVAYLVFNYSYLSEFKDLAERDNPDVFSHSITMEKPYSVTIPADEVLVIKKFDLVSTSGNVIFYMSYEKQYHEVDGITYQSSKLPFMIRASEGGYSIDVVKK